MKSLKLFLFFIFSTLLFISCNGQQEQEKPLVVDVNASYPKKDLILQDLFDVEYVPLETTDEFITHGNVKSTSKNIVVTTNWGGNGDIFLFDRATGKGLQKINHFGQSGEEYTSATEILVDEAQKELFVIDYSAKRILVYDLAGNFKRSFKTVEDSYYTNTFNYDTKHLLCYKSQTGLTDEYSKHILISKQDGSLFKEIPIPFGKLESPVFVQGEITVSPSFYLTVANQENWTLTETSADTIYNYLSDGTLHPIIERTPSIHEMDPQVFLYPTVMCSDYYFMKTQKKEFDMARRKGFPTTQLVYDKQENAIYEYMLYNGDWEEQIISFNSQPINQEVLTWQSMEAPDLIEANAAGKLKGKLKEITDKLDEDSNPVIMLIKPKR